MRTQSPSPSRPSTVSIGRAGERRVRLHYRLRGYRILAANVRSGGVEVDLVARRGRRLVFCEVKAKGGVGFGDPLEMVGPAKQARLVRAAEAWVAQHEDARDLELSFEVVALRGRRLERVRNAF
jgi:putative endonuclease